MLMGLTAGPSPVRRAPLCRAAYMAAIALLVGCGRQQSQPTAAAAPAPVTEPARPPHVNSQEILARCQPELKEPPSPPNFEVGENYNRAGVQLKMRFTVDRNGFVMNPYVTGSNVVTPVDQEAALDYVRHLTFETPAAEECRAVKMQMVGNFHMSKDSGGDWTTIFEAHPVYSFNGNQVVVNPN